MTRVIISTTKGGKRDGYVVAPDGCKGFYTVGSAILAAKEPAQEQMRYGGSIPEKAMIKYLRAWGNKGIRVVVV